MVASCSKDDEEDPRDQFVGTYSATQIITISSLDYYEVFTGTVVITKSQTPGKIVITDETVSTAMVSGRNYEYDKYSETSSYENSTITVELTGNGTLYTNTNEIEESGSITYYMVGQTFSGTWTRALTKL
jgi:hypothetical protein